jgi:glycosyltransferase involved in cell wall biosynthesis
VPDLAAIKRYAAEVGLERFVLNGSIAAPAEYQMFQSGHECGYRVTGRKIGIKTDSAGRFRIKAPVQFCGHVACTEPERLTSLFWCGDLLRRGYLFVHLPTSRGPKQVSLIEQFGRNLGQRFGLHRAPVADPCRTFRTLTRARIPRYAPEAGRVLMIIPNFIRGGAERQMVVTAAGLIGRGYDVRILGFDALERGVSGMDAEIAKLGITAQFCSDFREPEAGGWWRPRGEAALGADLTDLPGWILHKIGPVAAAILHHRPAVVHTWLDGPAVIGGLAACALGVPRVLTAQASTSIVHRRWRVDHLLSAYQLVAGNPNSVMLNNSAAGAADYARWLERRTRAIHVIYNGFMPETVRTPIPHEISEFRAGLGIPPEAPVVGTLIRFVEEKDPGLWLDTAVKIAEKRLDARFLLAGEGILHDHIMQRAAALGLAERIIMPGAISDVGLAYAAIDVVLLTSVVEGVPNVLVEAQAAGKPVVTTDVGGAREALIEAWTGLVVRQRSPEHLAAAVLAILSDKHWFTRVRTEGPKLVAERFGFERMIDQTIEAYETGKNTKWWRGMQA